MRKYEERRRKKKVGERKKEGRKKKEDGRIKKRIKKRGRELLVAGCEWGIKKPTASFGSGRLSFMMSMFDCLRWLDSSVRASVNTCTAVCASVGINRINITCRDSA